MLDHLRGITYAHRMKRAATIVLVVTGAVLAVLALNALAEASDDAKLKESICRIGNPVGSCDMAMDWSRPGLLAVGAVVAFGAAWIIRRSAEPQSAEDLVG